MGRLARKAAADEERRNPTKLTDKHRVFIQEYLISFNATKAATLAGYSKRSAQSTSSRLLSNPIIAAEIERQMEARAQNVDITIENVLKELASIGFAKHMVKDADKIKALELIGRNLGMFDGPTGGQDQRNRESSLSRFLGAISKHSGRE